MASEEVQATAWKCDAHNCGKRFVVENMEGLPDGFHGNAFEIGSFGGSASVTWYACSEGHIRSAVTSALAREAG